MPIEKNTISIIDRLSASIITSCITIPVIFLTWFGIAKDFYMSYQIPVVVTGFFAALAFMWPIGFLGFWSKVLNFIFRFRFFE